VVVATAVGAAPHRDHPPRFGHLGKVKHALERGRQGNRHWRMQGV
jgi:hypothetical protein